MEQLILETISRHMKEKKIISSQHRFTKGKSCLNNLVRFCTAIISLMDVRGAEDIVFPGFSKAFDTVPHKILIEKLLK